MRYVCRIESRSENYGVEEIKLAKQKISEGEDINYNGASGPVDFDEYGETNVSNINIYTITDSEFVHTIAHSPSK